MLGLKADPKMCIDCLTCSRNCPMSIDVHARVKANDMDHVDCILCGQCADNCGQDVIAHTFGIKRKKDGRAAAGQKS
ncbi:MAG: 4Fe-4S dicluster domain-containing protein [Candidatus Aminicenantaceae bacterium]